MRQTDVLIIGSGVAGCATALELAKQGIEVTVLSSAEEARQSSSFRAGNGIATVGPDDSPERFSTDIRRLGKDLCQMRAVEQLVTLGPQCIDEMLIKELNIDFEHAPDGTLSYSQADEHSTARTLRFRDHTGKAIMDAMLRRISELPNITLVSGKTAVDLITLHQHSSKRADVYKKPTCLGAYVLDNETHQVEGYLARETLLATGGSTGVFLHSTNSGQSRGDGVAMAHRAGVRLLNMEYTQFHPTVLHIPNEPPLLLTEALRDQGARLLDANGDPFMERYHEAGEMAPREVLARAIYTEMIQSGADHLWLDISAQDTHLIRDRFPGVYDYCRTRGYDMARQPLPIVPAAHYSMGGIAVDKAGQTSMQRLRAIGEVSCTGAHGVDRLATTALLEALVWARTSGEEIGKQISKFAYYFPPVDEWKAADQAADPSLLQQDWTTIRQTMWNYVGLVRDEKRLRRALHILQELQWEIESFYQKAWITPEVVGLRNGIETALLTTLAALRSRRAEGGQQPSTQQAEVAVSAVF